MVGEFPELQGVMGGIYAREDGEPEEVWRAIYHHYLPIGVMADAPPRPRDLGKAGVSWAAVSLADKLDTLVGLFQVGEKPTGSRDPFGLRRAGARSLQDLGGPARARRADGETGPRAAWLTMAEEVHDGEPSLENDLRLVPFLFERLRYVLEQRGYDRRNVRAVTHQTSLADIRPLDARRKLEVLPEFTGSADFLQLAALFKRVRNIAKELPEDEFDKSRSGISSVSSRDEEPAETQLREELEQRAPTIDAAVTSGEGYRAAFAEAARFGPAVDRFFADVLVMAEDHTVRLRRLLLLKRLERLILQLADVSEIVKEED